MCGCSSEDGNGVRAPGAVTAAKGSGKGSVQCITFIVMVVLEMERMEIDKDLDALNKGKLRLPFHHKKDDGSWATAAALEASHRTERNIVIFP